jgi:hypothetical protein
MQIKQNLRDSTRDGEMRRQDSQSGEIPHVEQRLIAI